MKFTNRANIPDAIVRAVSNDSYSKGSADYSVTQLLKPPRIVALERTHWEELEEDVSDRIWAMFGQALHVVAERANHKDVAERRLSITVNGIKVSGAMDLYQEGPATYIDYKSAPVYKLKAGFTPEEWTQQINLYATILRANGVEIKQAKVLAILRDWLKLEALRDHEYPQSQVKMIDIELWEPEKAVLFLASRIALHESAKTTLPLCTPEERWARQDKWAVQKPGAARATKLYDNAAPAKEHAEKAGLEVEFRPGENIRCAAYCSASRFCDQYKKLKGVSVK